MEKISVAPQEIHDYATDRIIEYLHGFAEEHNALKTRVENLEHQLRRLPRH